MNPSDFDALLIDLDDTLYAEHAFVDSGLRAVAAEAAKSFDADEATLLAHLRYDFAKYGRVQIFDRLVQRFASNDDVTRVEKNSVSVATLVACYRAHAPELAPYPEVEPALAKLQDHFTIAIVTDGAPDVQRRKLAALDLGAAITHVTLCWEIDAPKPSPKGFQHAARKLGVAHERALIIGDDPHHDIAAAVDGEFAACRVRTGRFAHIETPQPPERYRELSSFADVARWLTDSERPG
ncbi:MAG: HAD family hydrolase [Pseudomonadota bacterium]